MGTARTGAAVAAITTSILAGMAAPVLAQSDLPANGPLSGTGPVLATPTTAVVMDKFGQLEQLIEKEKSQQGSAGKGQDGAPDNQTDLQKKQQQVLELLKKQQQEALEQQLKQIRQLQQSQQATLAKLKQQQQEEAERKQQQALLEKQKQQAEQKQKQKTTAEKFKELKEAGIFQKGGNAGSNKSGPDDQQLSREQFAAVIGDALGSFSDAAYANYLQAIQGDPFAPSTQIDPQQLILAMLQGLNGMPGNKPGNPPGDDWAQQYIQAALEKGLLPKTQNNKKQLRDELIKAAEEKADKWHNYSFYPKDSFITPDALVADFLNPSGNGSAIYRGIVTGTDGSGDPLTGTSQINVDFDGVEASLSGAFDFGGIGAVELVGFYSGDSIDLGAEEGRFQDGDIVADSHFDANFYGPKAEEFGGDWSFNVTGGTAPGTASGQFAAKR